MLIFIIIYIKQSVSHKVLKYANSISYLKDKWVEYGEYGSLFSKAMLDDGAVYFVDRQGRTYKQVVNEISLHDARI